MFKTRKKKVFCIGFHKTGTTSIALALKKLGYKVTGPNGTRDPNFVNNVYERSFSLAEKYDAFQDNPWPVLYEEMDKKFPGSKFILLLRSSESWINSQTRYFGEGETPMRKWIYGVGCPKGNEEIYIKRFEKHNNDVLEYFKDRTKDLLVLNLSEGDGWEKLCPFLGKEILTEPFPHENKANAKKSKESLKDKILNKLRNIFT